MTRGLAYHGHIIRTPPGTPMPALSLLQLVWTSVEDGYRLRRGHVRAELATVDPRTVDTWVVRVTGIETREATMSVQDPGS